MVKSRRRGGKDSRRRLGFEMLEERRVLSVSVDIASKAAWSPVGANGDSQSGSQLLSADGRYLFVHSYATNLVAGLEYLAPGRQHIYRLEISSGEFELVSFAGSRNVAATGYCEAIDVSADGNVVLFRSDLPDLSFPSDGEGYRSTYYLRDMTSGLTRVINRVSEGIDRVDMSFGRDSLSADGSKLVFTSGANNLDPRDNDSRSDVFVFDFATGETELASVNWEGMASANDWVNSSGISADGAMVLFASGATNLHPLDTVAGTLGDLYVRNLVTGTTELVSVNSAGTSAPNSFVGQAEFSSDGRFVLFSSLANGLHADDQNDAVDVFVRDLSSGDITWVSRGFTGAGDAQFTADSSLVLFESDDRFYAYDIGSGQTSDVPNVPDNGSLKLPISNDGNIVAFSTRDALDPADQDTFGYDVYIVDRAAGTLRLASGDIDGLTGGAPDEPGLVDNSYWAAVTPDGSTIIFSSRSNNIVADDDNFAWDLFAYDVETGERRLLSKHADDLEWEGGNAESELDGQSVSADGRYVVFSSYASNLVEGIDSDLVKRIYRYDRLTGQTELVSTDLWGEDGKNRSQKAVISADGNVVAFLNTPVSSWGVPGSSSLYVRDIAAGTTRRIGFNVHGEAPSISADGRRIAFRRSDNVYVYDWNADDTQLASVPIEGTGPTTGFVERPVISANGRVVVFASTAYNLHPLDTYYVEDFGYRFGRFDVFARDLDAGVTHLVSINSTGTAAGSGASRSPSVSADGNVIAFESTAVDLIDASSLSTTAIASNIFVRDISTGITRLATVDYLGLGGGNGQSRSPVVSADGSVVAFSSVATNLNALDSSDNEDIYVFDRATGELRWASRGLFYGDGEATYDGAASVSLSGNGQVVGFTGYTGRYVAFAYNMFDGSTRELGNRVEPEFVDFDWGRKPTLNYDGSVAAFESGNDVYMASIDWDAPPLVGDYNLDGSVDAADYTVWRSALGQHELVAYSSADGNGDGSVDELDYAVWKSHFGERLAPARTPIVVDTLDDEDDGDLSPGDVSLREALAMANARPGLDQIQFADSLTAVRPATIRLSLGELEIADAVEIVGPGDELLTIDAQEQSRVLSVALITGDVALRGMTLKNGRTTGRGEVYDDLTYSGGAIRSFTLGRLFIDDCTISHNRTTGDYAGGGAVVGIGDVTITNSILSGNGTDGLASYGGALRTYGPLTLIDSIVSGNDTQAKYGAGGGIYAPEGVRIYGSLITGNSAQDGSGGGVSTRREATIRNSTISGNRTARGKGGGAYIGGSLTMYDTVVSGNLTLGDGAKGGGIYLGAPSAIIRSTIANNHTIGKSANGGGVFGRVLAIEDSNIVGNGTFGESANGGGISTEQSTIEHSTISDNLTVGGDANGGGIYSRISLSLVESTMMGNRTIGERAAGGGIWVSRELDVTASTISGNSTAGVGADGGGIAVPQSGVKSIVQSTITENRAINADAGGVWVGVGPLTLVDSVIAGNFAAGENADLRIDDAGMAATLLQGELEEEASGQAAVIVPAESSWVASVFDGSAQSVSAGGELLFADRLSNSGRVQSRPPAEPGAEGRVRVAAESRDLALLAWRSGLGRRGGERGLRVRDWELDRGGDSEDVAFEDVDAAIELLADGVSELIAG